jgi:hypothetical protein
MISRWQGECPGLLFGSEVNRTSGTYVGRKQTPTRTTDCFSVVAERGREPRRISGVPASPQFGNPE